DPTLIFSGTSDANVTITVYLDGVSIGTTPANGGGNWSFDYTGTALGDETSALTSTATDTAGNTSAASAAFNVTIDTAAPAVPTLAAIASNPCPYAALFRSDPTLIFSGTSDANVTITVYFDGASIGTTSANGSGNWSFDYTGT